MNEILDNNISLDEELHKYNLVNQPEVSFTSVTTYVEYFFEGFDAKKIATKLVRSHPKYSNHTVESLMRKWTETADYGTKVHNEIEQWFKKDRNPKTLKPKMEETG